MIVFQCSPLTCMDWLAFAYLDFLCHYLFLLYLLNEYFFPVAHEVGIPYILYTYSVYCIHWRTTRDFGKLRDELSRWQIGIARVTIFVNGIYF